MGVRQARPFLKWVGGKGKLLAQLERYYPKELKDGAINTYIEPFVGGGALYFALTQQYSVQRAYLFDLNRDLVLAYRVIQQKSALLIDYLEQYQRLYSASAEDKRRELFYAVRRQYNETRFAMDYKAFSDEGVARAAQFIFLNKTCYNGLFRLNLKGEFNTPFGRYKTANICDRENITAVAGALQNAEIINAAYSDCYEKVVDNTFIYFDPPYRPITPTSRFTAYIGAEFTDKQQLELAQFFQKLDKTKDAKLMLSNSDPTSTNPDDAFFEKAYNGYNIFKVSANRAVNCKGTRRGKINELLITNYRSE